MLTSSVYPKQHPRELHHGVTLDLSQGYSVVHIVNQLVGGHLEVTHVGILLLEIGDVILINLKK